MGNRKQDIDALLQRCNTNLAEIEKEYQASLDCQRISSDLRIDIKNLCGNLRSVLDYLASEIREKYCPHATHNTRFYFPILPDQQKFRSRMAQWFPDLQTSAPGLWGYLESIQPYHSDWAWLDQFNEVNNQNKHDRLIEQTRSEIQRVQVKMQGGGQVSWTPKNVQFGRGVYMGGVPVDPVTQMPVPHPSQQVKRIVWVDFRFDGIDVSALALLKKVVSGITSVSTEICKLL